AEWDCYSSQVGVPPSSIWSFGSDLPARLTAGDRARVVPGDANNLRDQPSTSGSRIGQVPGGAEFLVLDGPAFGDDLRWWLIDYNGLIGWTVEGQGTEYWLEPLSVR
ncbi:MAG: SH3 domain-containing protein, partial [Anaerolineae bacterium]|nr:SH3 domain-containing protein [Anaerolineae bacterium]